MADNQRSLFFYSFRALLTAMFTVIGVVFGFLIVIALLGGMGSSLSEQRIAPTHTAFLMPNAEGERKELCDGCPIVLQLNISGTIGTEKLNKEEIRQQLVESREGIFKNDRVKAILLYFNTPGGTVDDANGIYQELKNYKERYNVPIYAFVDGMCASGGMYVAAAADKIFSDDVSLIGHIGVILPPFFNVSNAMEKIGVQAMTIYAGKDKDAMNPTRPWKEGEQDQFQFLTNYFYNHFLDVISTNRPLLTKEKLEQAGAVIYPAQQAQEHGYIDVANSSLSQTLKELIAKAGIADKNYGVVRLESKNWFSDLFESKVPLFNIIHRIRFGNEVNPELEGKHLYLYRS